MLTCDELKYINRIPDESEISLKLYAEFFEKFIANRYYNIYLENNIKLIMQIAPTNYPHLIGLHKFKASPQFTGNSLLKNTNQLERFRGFINLKNERITLNNLKLVQNSKGKFIYDEYKTRILASPLMYQIIRNSEFLRFDTSKLTAQIKSDYIFVSNFDGHKLHLFIKNNNGTNYPVTFIPRSHTLIEEQLNYFTKGQDILKINKIEILDYKTKNILETIVPFHIDLAQQQAAATDTSIKTNIIELYIKECPAIKYVQESTAETMAALNKKLDIPLTVKEIKELHNETGKNIELGNKDKLDYFKTLTEVVDDIKTAQLTLKQEQAHQKAIENQFTKSKTIEL